MPEPFHEPTCICSGYGQTRQININKETKDTNTTSQNTHSENDTCRDDSWKSLNS
jgi:hypothetical protein